jgi:LPXTG-site transpeptidase (sortase) family protein
MSQRKKIISLKNFKKFLKSKKLQKKLNQEIPTLEVFLAVFCLLNFLFVASVHPLQPGNLIAGIKNPTQVHAQNIKIKDEPIEVEKLSPTSLGEPPSRIIIPRLNINLPVFHAKIIDGVWETTLEGASHGEGTANPGQSGNTVIFAHARVGLFLPLRYIQNQDQIYILTKNNWYPYQVKEIKRVFPNELEVISPTQDETLTLYTCDGFADRHRLIVIAKIAS